MMGAQVILALGLGLGATILLMLVLRIGHSIIHPGALMLLSWIGALFWHSLMLIEFEYTVLSPNTTALVMACLTGFTIGSLIDLRMRISKSVELERPRSVRRVDRVLAVLLVVGVVIFAVGLIPKWQKFASMGFSISEARVELWRNFDRASHSPASAVMAITRPAVIFLAVSIPVYWRRSRTMFVAAGVALLLLFLEDTADGGRSLTGFAVVGCFFTALSMVELDNFWIFRASALWRLLGLKKTYFAIVMGATLIYLCLGVFPVIRNPNIEKHLDHYLKMHLGSGTHFAPHVEQLSERLGRPDIRYFAYESRYLTSSMMRMNYMLNETDASEWYFLGGNNFTIFSKIYNRLRNQEGYSLLDVKKKIKSSQPYEPNPWICGIMDVVIDFGIVGAVVFMFIAGWFCAVSYGNVVRYGNQEFVVLQSLICVVIVSFPYTCRLQSNTFTLTALLAMAIALLRNVRFMPRS